MDKDAHKYADKTALSQKHIFEKDHRVPYDSDGKGTEKILLFRIRQIDVPEYEDVQMTAMDEKSMDKKDRLRAINDETIMAGVVKPVMDRGMLKLLRTNFPQGVYQALLEEIQWFSGFHAMQMKAAKNLDAPNSH